ncbi:hypothetical protein BU17DRAFT_17959, partial [Hysterangium stoloniferum]
HLYTFMIQPKVKYTLPVWYTPIKKGNFHNKGSVSHARNIEKVHRSACKPITGAIKCTGTDIIEY